MQERTVQCNGANDNVLSFSVSRDNDSVTRRYRGPAEDWGPLTLQATICAWMLDDVAAKYLDQEDALPLLESKCTTAGLF